MLDPMHLVVFCDREDDRRVFSRLQSTSEFLSRIPNENIRILPTDGLLDPVDSGSRINTLLRDDRPDYVFVADGRPVLVVELTEHGYTGDNPLQRFTRFAIAAEGGVPFVYFTPFSRVRDDELDRGDRNPSERHVNTDVFKGMSRLTDIFGVPLLALDWPKNERGKPRKLGANPSIEKCRNILGELGRTVEILLRDFGDKSKRRESILDAPWVREQTELVRALWTRENIRTSAVKIRVTRQELQDIIEHPLRILGSISREGYFFKDKPERLLLLYCIEKARVEAVFLPNGTRMHREAGLELLRQLLAQPVFAECLLYQTGYKWRSDPHCGVLVNLDYNYCRNATGRTTADRDRSLVLFWPRVFLSKDSRAYSAVAEAIKRLAVTTSEFHQLFLQRYENEPTARRYIAQLMRGRGNNATGPGKLIGIWGNNTKQARVFRHYCDLVLLGDAVLLGDRWRGFELRR